VVIWAEGVEVDVGPAVARAASVGTDVEGAAESAVGDSLRRATQPQRIVDGNNNHASRMETILHQ